MNTSSVSSASCLNATSQEFCVDSVAVKKYRTDEIWTEVPRVGSYGEDIEECWLDVWGEKTCSEVDDFEQVKKRVSPTISCRNAYKEDPQRFESERGLVESQPWTLTEMKKAMQWMFNCFGKLPPKVCGSATTQN